MQEILKAVHGNLCEITVKGQDVFRMAGAIQMLEQAISMTDVSLQESETKAEEDK